MNKLILSAAVAAILITSPVFASPGDDKCVGNCGGDSSVPFNSTAMAGAKSNANSKSVGVGIGMGGNASSRSSAMGGSAFVSNKQGNEQSLQYNEAKQDYSDTYKDYTAPGYAPSINATVPCAIPVTGGLTLPAAVGISGGSAYVDENCELRETVRLGLRGDATSKALANRVIQQKLLEYANESETEKVSVIRSKSNYEMVMGN